jgi:hypothetical protein
VADGNGSAVPLDDSAVLLLEMDVMIPSLPPTIFDPMVAIAEKSIFPVGLPYVSVLLKAIPKTALSFWLGQTRDSISTQTRI